MSEAVSSQVSNCHLVNLPKVHNRAGNITSINNNLDIAFSVKRVYYLYDIPGGENRGGHAHKELIQLLVAVSGSFEVKINDGKNQKTIYLNQPDQGLIIVPGIWRELQNFSSGSICLVLASEKYTHEDYIREITDFINFKK